MRQLEMVADDYPDAVRVARKHIVSGACAANPDLDPLHADPLRELAVIAFDPTTRTDLRITALTTLAKYMHTQTKTVQANTDRGDGDRKLANATETRDKLFSELDKLRAKQSRPDSGSTDVVIPFAR